MTVSPPARSVVAHPPHKPPHYPIETHSKFRTISPTFCNVLLPSQVDEGERDALRALRAALATGDTVILEGNGSNGSNISV